jgi:hypothetical protein
MLTRAALPLVALALAVPAQAQSTVEPDHLIDVMKDAGYKAEYFSQESDVRQILSETADYQFLVELYGCKQGKACNTVDFFVNVPMDNPPDKAALDAYDGPREGAEISLDRQGKPRMIYEIEMPDEGLTDEQFIASIKSWETMLAGFVAFLSGKPAPANPAAADAAAAAAAAPAADAS